MPGLARLRYALRRGLISSRRSSQRERRRMPGIHVFLACRQDVDGRDKPGHDAVGVV